MPLPLRKQSSVATSAGGPASPCSSVSSSAGSSARRKPSLQRLCSQRLRIFSRASSTPHMEQDSPPSRCYSLGNASGGGDTPRTLSMHVESIADEDGQPEHDVETAEEDVFSGRQSKCGLRPPALAFLRSRTPSPVGGSARSPSSSIYMEFDNASFDATPAEFFTVDMRSHVVKELYDTEDNYVNNLQLMVQKYMRPLKRPELCTLVEPALVDEIFFQIPEILAHHEKFHAALKCRLDNWDGRQKIGDIVLNNFTKQPVMDTYSAFINNWKSAKAAIRRACRAKPAFAKYLERCSREHKNKLTLDALLIMPVQRIPRYELLIKELLKHTSVEHPDHALLVRAQKEVHALATRIDRVEQDAGRGEQMLQRLREIEAIVNGLDDLVSAERLFHSYEVVKVSTTHGTKDRCLFLLSDMLIITSVKRRTNALKKNLSGASTSSHDFLENHKFKLLMKICLDDLEVAKNTLPLLHKLQEEVNNLQEDLKVVAKVSELGDLLKHPHSELTETVDALKSKLQTRLKQKNHEIATDPVFTEMYLLVTTEDGIETLTVTFSNAEKRAGWEKSFRMAKETLERAQNRRTLPTFIKPLQVHKTRFTCASATCSRPDNSAMGPSPLMGSLVDPPAGVVGSNSNGSIGSQMGATSTASTAQQQQQQHGPAAAWICNSDGYVGQLCVLTLCPEPDMYCCNGMPTSRVVCIIAVPAPKAYSWRRRKRLSVIHSESVDAAINRLERATPAAGGTTEGCSETASSIVTPATSKLELDSSDSSSDEEDFSATGALGDFDPSTCPGGGRNNDTCSVGTGTTSSRLTLAADEDDLAATMWLGTEDGSILVYPSADYGRSRQRPKLRVQHDAAVNAMCYADERVFVGLHASPPAVVVYERAGETGWTWDLTAGRRVNFAAALCDAVTALAPAPSRLWCASGNMVHVVNLHTEAHDHSLQVSTDSQTRVTTMAAGGLGLWLALQGSAVVKLYHVLTYECLLEMNVCPAVTRALSSRDDVIKQHKLGACLRVTALLCVKDTLWIGTSAGVLLHAPLPHLSHNGARLAGPPPVTVSPVGHAGQCRFLIAVDPHAGLSRQNSFTSAGGLGAGASTAGQTNVGQPTASPSLAGAAEHAGRRRMSLNVAALQQGKIYVLSGGDGFDDYQKVGPPTAVPDDDDDDDDHDDAVGQADSANHLLIWEV